MASPARRADPAGIVIAGLLLAAAAVIWWDMTSLQITSVYGVGPKAMPIVIAIGLAVLALANLAMALHGDLPARETTDPKAIALILGGLAALIELMAKMVKSKSWADILKQKGWDDAFLAGDDFAKFLKDEQARVKEVLISVGLVKS